MKNITRHGAKHSPNNAAPCHLCSEMASFPKKCFQNSAAEVDQAQTDTQINWLEATHQADPKDISEFMVIIIQEEDVDSAVETLNSINVPIVRMPSAGEFLGRQNATILIGIDQGKKEFILNSLQQSVRQRVEFLHQKRDGSAPKGRAARRNHDQRNIIRI